MANPSPAMAPGRASCPACGRWFPAPDDKFCAWCGGPLVLLAIDPESLEFKADSKEGNERILNLRNEGINTAYISVEVEAAPAIQKRFKLLPERKYGAFEIPGGRSESLTITFNNQDVDANTDYSARLKVLTHYSEKAFLVPLRVERAPKGRLIVPAGTQKIIYGDPAVVTLRVQNDGGGLLRITSVSLEEPQAGSHAISDGVGSGAETKISIPLDAEKLKPGNFTASGKVTFDNYEPLAFKIDFVFKRPARMRINQRELRVEAYNIGRLRHAELKLENIGVEPFTIASIKTRDPWVSTLYPNRKVAAGRAVFVDVFVDARKLPEGFHETYLEITSDAYDGVQRIPVQVLVRHLPPLTEPIGIDFGTALSCAATVKNGVPELIDLDEENKEDSIEGRSLPSIVFFEENHFPIVGKAARDRALFNPAAAICSVKRFLGNRRPMRIRGEERSATEVTSEIFRAILAAIERSTEPHASPVNALLTVPADVPDEQIKNVLNAAKNAGLAIEDLETNEFVIDEPTAAAMHYLYKRQESAPQESTELVFIYDFGAGTLDCSLVEIKQGKGGIKLRVLATSGNRRLGGDDIDLALAQSVAAQLAKKSHYDLWPVLAKESELDDLGNKNPQRYQEAVALRRHFRQVAERLKIELSTAATAEGNFQVAEKSEKVTVTRQQFEELLKPFIRGSDSVVLGCCTLAAIQDRQHIGTVLHTGRGSAVPKIRQRIKELLPAATDRSELIQPKECVALGAAWWAYIKNVPGSRIEFERVGKLLPNTICYRGVAGGVRVVFNPIFEAGQHFPDERVIRIPSRIRQRTQIDIFEKPFGSDEEPPRPRGSIMLPPLSSGTEYECKFSLNLNRILEVTVGDQKLEIVPSEDAGPAEGTQ